MPDDLPEGEIGLPKLAVAGALEPSALRVHTTAGPVGFRAMSGTVEFSPSEVTFTGVTGRAENWSFAADGVWRQQGDGSVLDADLSLDADGIPDQLFALLPQAVREATRAIELNVHGNTTARDVAVHVTRHAGMPDVFDVAGTILVTDADARLGLPITEMDAALDFRAKSAAQPNADGPLTLGFRATRLRALGLRMSNVTAAVRRGETPGSLVVPELTGDCHGGRLVGSVRLGSAPTGALEERPWDGTPYWADIRLAGVRAAPFIADLRASAIESTKPVQNMAVFATTPLPGGVNAGSTLAVWSEAADHSRGVLDASLTLSGDTGSSASRLGTGEVRVAGGPLVTMPLVFTLIELSNLTLPVGDRLDTALAQFSIDGDRVVFEQLSARSSTVELFGYGTMDWPTKELDLRLHSRAVNGIPLISDIIENIRDEIVTARITGPLGDVKVKTEQFSAARRVLTALLGGGAGEADRRLREMERAARQSAGDTRLDARRAASRAAAEPVRGTVIEEGG